MTCKDCGRLDGRHGIACQHRPKASGALERAHALRDAARGLMRLAEQNLSAVEQTGGDWQLLPELFRAHLEAVTKAGQS